jgi:hypothetical protein
MQRCSNESHPDSPDSELLLDCRRAQTGGGSGLGFADSELLLLDQRPDSELLLDRSQGGSHPASPG